MQQRRDPFSGSTIDVPREPLVAVHSALPTVLERRAGTRKSRISPSEVRRKERMLTVTFSDSTIADRLREVAVNRGWYTLAGQPNVSRVVEGYVLSGLDAEK